MNKVILIGNLTKDPELEKTNNGVHFCRFTLAVQRKFANANGEKEADFLNIIAWRAQAENVAKYLKKGNKAAVSGTINTRSYDAPDGTKRNVTEINADEVEFLNTKPSEEFTPVDIDDDDLPF